MTTWTPRIGNAMSPRYRAVLSAIEQAIVSSELQPGQRLPTQREMARKLDVSVQTVSRAYAEAERLRLISSKVGRGTFVQHAMPVSQKPASSSPSPENRAYDFSSLTPLLSNKHVQALMRTLADLSAPAHEPCTAAGELTVANNLRHEAAAAWLGQLGLAVSPDKVIVTNDAEQGLSIASTGMAGAAGRVGMACLTDNRVITAASTAKCRLLGLALDNEGLVPEALEEACIAGAIRAIYIDPSCSNPTAAMMGKQRREEIVEICRRYDLTIIECDVFRPLMGTEPPPLWSFAPERTWYITTFANAISGWLRTGYLVPPTSLSPNLSLNDLTTDQAPDNWVAEVSAKWMSDGTADRLVKWQQKALAARHGIFDELMGNYHYARQPHGPHVWLTLPEPWRASQFLQHAKMRDLLVASPESFIVGPAATPHAIRITLGNGVRSEDEFRQGVTRLRGLLSEAPDPVALSLDVEAA